MKQTLMTVFVLLAASSLSFAQEIDVSKLEKIGSVTSFVKTERGITLDCGDNSQVQLTVLAPDLIRVRASFTKPIPSKDHSWAIAKEAWETPMWRVTETGESIVITTAEVEVVMHRSPFLIDFRNARTHETINADERPMAYDGKGA